jgi:hypothetical protein
MKVPTVKDLQKVWDAYPRHSAQTTLLLDDSVDKAQLQSYNHICVSKYTAEIRSKDEKEYKSSLGSKLEPVLDTEMLIAVVGILETMRSEENVSAWLGCGGLRRHDINASTNEISEDLALQKRMDSLSLEDKVNTIWFDDPSVLSHWIERGRAILNDLQIPIDHGMAKI